MKNGQMNRREALEKCIVRGLLVVAAPVSASALFDQWLRAEEKAPRPTPTEVLGPFYKKGAPDLSVLRRPGEPGLPLRVTGSVTNTRGEQVPGAHVALWHTDHFGRYDVMGYRFRAEIIVGEDSNYGVETIIPGHYPSRPAQHIHYLVTAPGHKPLITQAYFATDPWFEGDPDKNYGRIAKNRELVRPVTLYPERDMPLKGRLEMPGGEARAAITFDICLERT